MYRLLYSIIGQYYACESSEEFNIGEHLIVRLPFGGIEVDDIVEVRKESPRKDERVVKVVRKANENDLRIFNENVQKDKASIDKVREIISGSSVELNLINVHFAPFEKMLIVFFSSRGHVDFRSLLPPLIKEFRVNINLHQVSFRSLASYADDCGVCGRKLCCRTMPHTTSNIYCSMKKIKDQKDFVNISKMQGPCGKFFCCFSFEEDFYKTQIEKFPQKGDKIIVSDDTTLVVKELNYVANIIKAANDQNDVMAFNLDKLIKISNNEWKIKENSNNL